MLTLSAFLGGGSLHGVVVGKIFRPLHSLGTDGIYRLEVRDGENKVRRQMVSHEIFALYDVGDVFDDKLSVEEVRRRHEAVRVRKAAAVAPPEKLAVAPAPALASTAVPAASPTPTASPAPDQRIAANEYAPQLFLQLDRLPETEGF